MNERLVRRLCLGTAQFGLPYGIANTRGKITQDEAFEILEYAHSKGINTLDTAYTYGDSEETIGKFIDKNKPDFKIISKISSVDSFNSEKVKELLSESLSKLRVNKIYGYLIHKFDDFLKYEWLWGVLEDLKREHLIEKIGFSLYKPQELETLFNKGIDFDILQIPYSIFDRRFEKYFKGLKSKDVEIYARSVFLQGLVFLKPANLPRNLTNAKIYSEKLQNLALENDVSINTLCLNFVLLNPDIDRTMIGIDSSEHLKENVGNIKFIQKINDIYNQLDELKIEDEEFFLPHKWDYVRAQKSKNTQPPTSKIGSKIIGAEDLFFVVEEGQANLGSFKKALSTIDTIAATGADAVEFQLAKADDFYVKQDPGHKIYLKREFTDTQIRDLIAYARNKGMEFIAVPLSHKIIEPLAKWGCSAFNINASDLTNPDIIDAVIDSNLPFFLSLPLATEEEIDWAISRIRKKGASNYMLLHGQHSMASSKDTLDVGHTSLGYIATLKKKHHLPIGYVDHTPFLWMPAAAVSAGADIVTKHLALLRKDKGPDWQICLEPDEMKKAVMWAKKMRKSIKAKSKNLAPSENIDKTKMRRSIVAAKKLKAGNIIKRGDILFKRPGTGICPSIFEEIIGKRVIRDIQPDNQISLDNIEKE